MSSYNSYAQKFKAFCDPNRLRILNILLQGEQCACKIQDNMNVGQSTLSHHMKLLVDSKIVLARKEGKWVHYSLSEQGISDVIHYLNSMLEEKIKTNDECICKGEKE